MTDDMDWFVRLVPLCAMNVAPVAIVMFAGFESSGNGVAGWTVATAFLGFFAAMAVAWFLYGLVGFCRGKRK